MRFSPKPGMSQEQLELHPSSEFLVEEIVKSYTMLMYVLYLMERISQNNV